MDFNLTREFPLNTVCSADTAYINDLWPLSLLSFTLQRDDADIVSNIEYNLKSAKALQLLAEKDPHECPNIKLLKKSISDSDGQQEYQGVPILNVDAVVHQCMVYVLADMERLQEKIKERLSCTDTYRTERERMSWRT